MYIYMIHILYRYINHDISIDSQPEFCSFDLLTFPCCCLQPTKELHVEPRHGCRPQHGLLSAEWRLKAADTSMGGHGATLLVWFVLIVVFSVIV